MDDVLLLSVTLKTSFKFYPRQLLCESLRNGKGATTVTSLWRHMFVVHKRSHS